MQVVITALAHKGSTAMEEVMVQAAKVVLNFLPIA